MPINPESPQRIRKHTMRCRPKQLLSSVMKPMSCIKLAFFFNLKSSWLGRLPWFFKKKKKSTTSPTWLPISNHTLLIRSVIKSWRLHNRAFDVPRRSGSSFTATWFNRSQRCSEALCSPSARRSWESTECAEAEQRCKKKKKKDVIGVGSGMKGEGQVPQTLGKDKAGSKEAPALFSFYCEHRLRNRWPLLASVTLTPVRTRPRACWKFHTLMPPSACLFLQATVETSPVCICV